MHVHPRRIAPLALVTLAAFTFGCGKKKQTVGTLRDAHPELAAALVRGVSSAFDAAFAAPAQPSGAACERPGLTLNLGPSGVGNAEVVSIDALEKTVEEGKRHHSMFQSYGAGSLSADWAARLSLAPTTRIEANAEQALLQTSSTKQLIVVKWKTSASHVDVFLVDFPATKTVCGFGVDAPTEPPYDPATGEPTNEGAINDRLLRDQQRLAGEVDRQLTKRFGVSAYPSAPKTPSELQARARHGAMLAAMKGPAPPACTTPPPAGSVETTVKRLRIYAGAAPLPASDPDVFLEPTNLISADFRALVAPDKAAGRDAVLTRLAAAPATLVTDIESETDAVRHVLGARDTFDPGVATARQVRFGRDGNAMCQTRVNVRNPSSFTVTYRHAYVDAALQDASRNDLRAQIEAAFTAPR